MMEPFYEAIENFIDGGRRCPDCDEWLWASYSGGYFVFVCLSWQCTAGCDRRNIGDVQRLGIQPEPVGLMPARFESKVKTTAPYYRFDHERSFYRLRDHRGCRRIRANWRMEGFRAVEQKSGKIYGMLKKK